MALKFLEVQRLVIIQSVRHPCYSVSLCFLSEQMRDHVVLETLIVENKENESEYDGESLQQPPYVTQPIKKIVRFPVYPVQVQVQFNRHSHVDVIKVLIGSH